MHDNVRTDWTDLRQYGRLSGRAQNARLIPKGRMRHKKPALKRLVGMNEKQYRKLNGNCDIWMAYVNNLDEALTTREHIAERLTLSANDIPLAEVGATISDHTGPGAVCIAMSPRALHNQT